VLALSGFHYSAVAKKMEFAAQEGSFFWSTGYAWAWFSLAAQTGHGRQTLSSMAAIYRLTGWS